MDHGIKKLLLGIVPTKKNLLRGFFLQKKSNKNQQQKRKKFKGMSLQRPTKRQTREEHKRQEIVKKIHQDVTSGFLWNDYLETTTTLPSFLPVATNDDDTVSPSSLVDDVLYKLHPSLITTTPTDEKKCGFQQSIMENPTIISTGLFGHIHTNFSNSESIKAPEMGSKNIVEAMDGKYMWTDVQSVDYANLPACEKFNPIRIFGIAAIKTAVTEACLRLSPFPKTLIYEEQTLLANAPINTIGSRLQERWDSDETFGLQRFQGPNPGAIQQVLLYSTDNWWSKQLVSCDDKVPKQYFTLNYRDLEKFPLCQTMCNNVFAPFCVLSAPIMHNTSAGLIPEYITLSPTFHATRTGSHGWKWRYAKMAMRCAEFNHHELINHLTYCHLVTEVFIMATMDTWRGKQNNMIYRLLVPHFSRTLAVNNAARSLLVPWLKRHLSIFSAEGVDQVIQTSLRNFDCGFYLDFENNLFDRGFFNVAQLPKDYYYARYGMELWLYWKAFLHEILQSFDVPWEEVQHWSMLIRQRIPSFPAFETCSKDQLIGIVCGIIFNASAQHSAVNDTQHYFMAFVPNAPCRLMKPVPKDSETDKKWKDRDWKRFYFDSLPNKETMDLQQDLVALLALEPPTNSNLAQCVMDDYAHFVVPTSACDTFAARLQALSHKMREEKEYIWLDPYLFTRSVIR